MRKLSDMNHLCNSQNVILLYQNIESRFEVMYQKYFQNLRKCNSASSLSGCIQRDLSKLIITLPTSSSVVEIFEKTLTSGFSGVNTRLAFDIEILLPNHAYKDFEKIDQTFKAFKGDDLKTGYNLKLDREIEYSDRRIISKISKLDENNQY